LLFTKANFLKTDILNEKGSESERAGLKSAVFHAYARWASTSRSGGVLGYKPIIPLTLPGTGGSRVQRHESYFFGMDAAALIAVNGTTGAENAKGVFYDN